MSPLSESLPYVETTRRADVLGQLGDSLLGLAMILVKEDFDLMVRDLRKVAWRFTKDGGSEITRPDLPAVTGDEPEAA